LPEHVEILVGERKIARHTRSFGRYQKIEHPSHREKLLNKTPHGKYERIYHLVAEYLVSKEGARRL
jgi:hypothetical protein